MQLFRPIGLKELGLVYDSGMRAFPPRLPEQPIFYPVTSGTYARQIAKDWNTKAGTLAGFVTRFKVETPYVSKFERRVVGSREHEELWVPAEELAVFNEHIIGAIEVIEAYFGEGYRGHVPESFGLKGKDAAAQFLALARTLPYSGFDVVCEMAANARAVFLNFFFWEKHSFVADGVADEQRDELLAKLRTVWANGERVASALGAVP
jgi:hypothetical protein